MTDWDWFILAALLVPVATALACPLVASGARKSIVLLASLVSATSALWLYFKVGVEPVIFYLSGADRLVFLTDISILLYIILIAVKRRHYLLTFLGLLQLMDLVWLELLLRPDTSQVPSLIIDRLAVLMYMVVALIGAVIAVYSLRYMEEGEERSGRFFLWIFLFLGSMNGLVLANNLFWFYLFWEATTLCSFELIAHRGDKESARNALQALFYNSIGGLAVLAGISILVLSFGGAAASLLALVESGMGLVSNAFLYGIFLLSVGAFIKAAQFPFQSWLLGAMVAPTPVSALLHSSTMVKAGAYLILRLAPAYSGILFSSAVALFGAFSYFAAALLAVRETDAKRVLAYSTVSNLGLIVACAGINTPLAVNAAAVLIVFHAVAKAMLFMAVGVIEHRLATRDIEGMEGLAETMPVMAAFLVFGAISMFLMPFGMLFGKWAALEASIREPLFVMFFVAGSTLTLLFWAKWAGRLSLPVPLREADGRRWSLSAWYSLPLGVLALGSIGLSIGIGTVINRLVVPASIIWYQPALETLPGLKVAAFSWASHFNPEIILGNQVFPEGLFPTGLVFGGLILTVLSALLFCPAAENIASTYLCGENADSKEGISFVTSQEETIDVSLGGYYYKDLLDQKLAALLNVLAFWILVLTAGVVATL